MKNRKNYFVLNKKSDFEGGQMGNPPYFISKICDAKQKGTIWHRMRMKCNQRHLRVTISVYSTDDLEDKTDRAGESIQEILYESQRTLEDTKRKISIYLRKTLVNQQDFLLHEVKGRYVWFIMEFFPEAGQTIEVPHMQLYFPKDTWLSYLPEVYQKEKESADFLERFLGIFQSLYEDLNDKIKYSFEHFQPDVCEKKDLTELASWVHLENAYVWQEEQLRHLLSNSMHFYSYRGTVKSLLEIVQLYTGEPAYVIEQHKLDIERAGKRRELMNSLYGSNPYFLTLLVKEEQISSEKAYKTLADIVDDIIPAQMECNIVVLRPYLFLDKHTYLGMNSILGKYKAFHLKQSVVLPFCSLEQNG